MTLFLNSLIRVSILHKCTPQKHRIWGDAYGTAIDECFELDDGTLVAGNGEYYNYVNYCPFCGYKAKTPIENLK